MSKEGKKYPRTVQLSSSHAHNAIRTAKQIQETNDPDAIRNLLEPWGVFDQAVIGAIQSGDYEANRARQCIVITLYEEQKETKE